MIWNELTNLKEKDALCYFCYRPKDKCICKKEKDPFKECSIKGLDITINECTHPREQLMECCKKFSLNRALCVLYRKCTKCGAEMPFHDITARCEICIKENFVEPSEECTRNEKYASQTMNTPTKNNKEDEK